MLTPNDDTPEMLREIAKALDLMPDEDGEPGYRFEVHIHTGAIPALTIHDLDKKRTFRIDIRQYHWEEQ